MTTTAAPPTHETLEAALELIEMGFRVFPCGEDKKPLTAHGVHDATDDPDKVRAMFARFPRANIGLNCEGIFLLDIDAKGGILPKWWQAHSDLFRGVDAPHVFTPGGGIHVYFKRPEGVNLKNSASKIAPHIDTRTGGGYVLVPPSCIGGKAYRWGAELTHKDELPEVPDGLLDILRRTFGGTTATTAPTPQPKPRPPASATVGDTKLLRRVSKYMSRAEGVAEGGRNARCFELSCVLCRDFDLPESEALPHLVEWNAKNTPPLSHDELARTLESATKSASGQPGSKRDAKPEQNRPRQGAALPDVTEQATTAAAKNGEDADPAPAREIIDADTWLRTHPLPDDPIVENLFATGDKVVLIAPSKARKTFFLLQAALSLASGTKLFQWTVPQPWRGLFANLEVKPAHFHRRTRTVSRGCGIEPSQLQRRLQIVNLRGDPDPRGAIEEAVENTRPDFVIIDPIFKLYAASHDENSAGDAAELMKWFDHLTLSGCAVIFSHHDRKSGTDSRTIDRGSGSALISRDFDCGIFISPHESEEEARVVETVARNYAPTPPFCVRFEDGHFVPALDLNPIPETSQSRRRRQGKRTPPKATIAAEVAEWMTDAPLRVPHLLAKVRAEYEIGEKAAREVLDLCEVTHGILREKSPTDAKHYAYQPQLGNLATQLGKNIANLPS